MNRVYKSDEGERKVRDRYLAFLKRWPLPNQQIRAATSQGETFVVASGPEGAPPLLVPIGNSDLSEMMEVAASSQFSFDARCANLDHSFAVCLPLASRCGTRKSGPPPPGQRLEALCETSAEADAGRPSVVGHPIASLE
jgi:hypothetical protein